MKIGLVFPQTEFSSDPGAIRAYTVAAEELGFSHILAYDHILGANPDRPGGWQGVYNHQDPFMEPLILFSYMAGISQNLEFASGIIILPQRETALVAKQAATLDVLCGGRLRLGMGIGWNKVEYQALNKDFHTRGRRVEEQIELLRRLWTEPLVTYEGRWHHIPDAGLNPLPVQRPIPIWFGGHADAVLQRTARIGDGWMPNYRTPAEAAQALDSLARYLAENGRSFQDIGLEARIHWQNGDIDELLRHMEEWREAGATHITFNTMNAGLSSDQEHLEAIRTFAAAL